MAKKNQSKKEVSKPKRALSPGLVRWNKAKSVISAENKLVGKKLNGKEINRITKEFLFTKGSDSFNQDEIKSYLNIEIQNFYNNPLDLTLSQLGAVYYYYMDSKIQEMPKNIEIEVNAGDFGEIKFNSSNYDYEDSGLRDIVEKIRAYFKSKGIEKSPEGNEGLFDGFIRKKKKTPKDSKNHEDYYIQWILYIDDAYSTDIRGSIPPKSDKGKKREKKKVFEIKVKKKGKKQKEEVKVEPIQPKLSPKEIISIEKAKQKTEAAKQKTMEYVLKLMDKGYTKEEINKLLGL